MSIIVEDFENLKISALNKAKRISKDVKSVTIGPNCTRIDKVYTEHNNNSKENTPTNIQKDERNNKKEANILYDRYPIGRLLAEVEAQRRDEVESSIRSRVADINAASQRFDSNSRNQWLRRQQIRIEQNRRQEDMMLQILQEHDKKAYDLSEQLQLQYQKQQDERHKRNLELQTKEKERRQLIVLMEGIHNQQIMFRSIYQDIVGILKGLNNAKYINKILTNANNSSIKSLPETMDKIKEKCKAQKATTTDLHLACSLVQEVMKLKDTIAQEVVQMNEQEKVNEQEKIQAEHELILQEEERLKEEQAKIIAEQTLKQKELELSKIVQEPEKLVEKPIMQPIPTQIPSEKSISDDFKFVSRENLHMFAELQQYLDTYENSFKHIMMDPKLKPFKFGCQKAVNIPLNAISSISSQHLHDKYQRLANLLSGKNVEAGGTVVCASQHPQGVAFCTNLLAKKFVLQGDLIVSSNPESAYCFSAVLTALWIDFPDFGKLVLAHFHKEMPYLVPMYPIMINGQTDQDYYKNLGYHYIDGVVEKQDKFLKRMSGIMRLYSAVMISRLKKGHHDRMHPHGLGFAWRWFASMLNLEPNVDITATLIFEFLEVAGSTMQSAYGNQFKKLIVYLNDIYLPKIQKIDSGGPMTRLEVLLQKIRTSGHIPSPKGRLAEGFW